MARGSKISPTIKTLITEEALRYPGKPRAVLALELQNTIRRLEGEGKDPPGQETLEKMISHARNHESPLDKMWDAGTLTLAGYELNPLAVQKIFELKVKGLPDLTIRTALWISRLCELKLSVDMLFLYARLYSYGEWLCEINKQKDFVTSRIDRLLANTLQNPEKACLNFGDDWRGDYERANKVVEIYRKEVEKSDERTHNTTE